MFKFSCLVQTVEGITTKAHQTNIVKKFYVGGMAKNQESRIHEHELEVPSLKYVKCYCLDFEIKTRCNSDIKGI